MASLFQKLFSKIFAVVKPTIPTPQGTGKKDKTTTGRSGAPTKKKDVMEDALEKIAQRRQGLVTESPEEKQKRLAALARDPTFSFIYLGVPIVNGRDFQSSNVQWIQYDVEHSSLYITYIKNGCTYRYWPVSDSLAREFFHAPSKGVEVWDELRIRGTNLGHRKNYILVGSSPAGALPKWTQSIEQITAHDKQVAQESGMPLVPEIMQIGQTGAQPYKAIGKFLKQTPQGTVMINKEDA